MLAAINTAQGLLPIIAIVGSFLTAVVAFGGWLYRTADARLSVVDLIAGEIFSICRAAATNRSVEKLINAYETEDYAFFAFLALDERYDQIIANIGTNFGFMDQYMITRIVGYYASLKIFLG